MKSTHLQPILESTDAMSPRRAGKRRGRKRWIYLVVALVFGTLIYAALKTSRLGYESPEYEVVEKNGKLELRNYAAMTTVSTPMGDGSQRSGMNRGFGQLFKYITGNNESSAKVAMTTPVLIDAGDGGQAAMNFVVPKAIAAAGAPEPKGENVSLREFSGGEFAVIRFRGFRKEDAISAAEKSLRKWIHTAGWSAEDTAMLAYYDPPWTPEFLRRNELLIRVAR